MTVGQQLHQARTARKLSFTDVTATTKIQPWVLEALEGDRLTELMSPVYVKGFLGSYAKFLKLEPAALLAELRWPGTPEPVQAAAVVATPAPEPAPEPQFTPEPVRWERPAPVQQQDMVPPPAPRRRPSPSPKPARPPIRVKLPTFQLPAIRVPNMRLPRFTMPRVTLPRVSMPKISMPRITLPRLTMPRIQMPQFHLPRVEFPSISPMVWRRAAQAVALGGVIIAIGVTHPLARLKKLPWPTVASARKDAAAAKNAEPTIKIVAKPAEIAGKAEVPAGPEKVQKAEQVEKIAQAEKLAEKPARVARAERRQRGERAQQPVEKPAPRLAAANVAPISGDVALKPPAPLAPSPVALAPLELAMTANRTTWIKITADGKLLSQQRLGRGANERWTARKQFEIVISKPSQVEISLNGQSINAFAVAHNGKLLISHRGIVPLPEPRSLADADSR